MKWPIVRAGIRVPRSFPGLWLAFCQSQVISPGTLGKEVRLPSKASAQGTRASTSECSCGVPAPQSWSGSGGKRCHTVGAAQGWLLSVLPLAPGCFGHLALHQQQKVPPSPSGSTPRTRRELVPLSDGAAGPAWALQGAGSPQKVDLLLLGHLLGPRLEGQSPRPYPIWAWSRHKGLANPQPRVGQLWRTGHGGG